MSDESNTENKEIKNLNRWLIALAIFVTIWSIGIFIYVSQKVEPSDSNPVPPIVMDGSSNKIANIIHTNPIPFKTLTENNLPPQSMYVQKDVYKKNEVVIINYFFVEGIVMDRSGDNYTIMYKDRSGTLQRIIVPKTLLLVPSSYAWMNPAGLIAE